MIWIKYKYDSIGRKFPISEHTNKSEIRNLKPGEGAESVKSMDEFIQKAAAYNQMVAFRHGVNAQTIDLSAPVQNTIQLSAPVAIDPEKISESGIALIREYRTTQTDLLLGKIMTAHNTEEWSSFQFCCGSQKEQVNKLLNQLIQEHGIQLGLE